MDSALCKVFLDYVGLRKAPRAVLRLLESLSQDMYVDGDLLSPDLNRDLSWKEGFRGLTTQAGGRL